MLVTILFQFQPKKALTLALSMTFLGGHLVLASPETPDSNLKAGASGKTASSSTTQSGGATLVVSPAAKPSTSEKSDSKVSGLDTGNPNDSDTEQPSASTKGSSDEDDASATASTATTDDTATTTVKAAGDASAELTPDELHEDGIRHWTISKKYMKDWDLDLAQVELDLAIMDYPELKIAHRDLCIVSLMKFNLWRSVAEFMMTVGLGEPIPMTEDESTNLLEDGMVKHYKKGLSFARIADWKKAANELELASQLVTEDFAVQRSLAYCYANLGDFAKAEEHYKKTFELSPHDGSSRADLAYFLAQNGKVSEAQKEMEEAVKSQPKAAAYHVDLSWMAESRGDLDTAIKELQAAVELSPTNADLWSHLGKVLERKGSNSDAINAYIHAVSLDPAMTNAKESLAKLQAPAATPGATSAPI